MFGIDEWVWQILALIGVGYLCCAGIFIAIILEESDLPLDEPGPMD